MTPRMPIGLPKSSPGGEKPNPFLSLNADQYSVETTLDYFEPTQAWKEVQLEENQVVFGSYGSGKSILLKRLQASAMARSPLFDSRPFLGVYLSVQVDVTLMDALMEHAKGAAILRRWPDASERAGTVAERWLALTLAGAALCELTEATRREVFGPLSHPSALAATFCRLFEFDARLTTSLAEVRRQIDEARADIHDSCSSPHIFDAPFAEPVNRIGLSIVAEAIAEQVSQPGFFANYKSGLPVYYLVDQLEALSPRGQALFTPLLRRGNPYFTKCAARLYGFRPDPTIAYVPAVDDDFFPLFVGYTDEQQPELRSVTVKVANKMLAAGRAAITIEQLLLTRPLNS